MSSIESPALEYNDSNRLSDLQKIGQKDSWPEGTKVKRRGGKIEIVPNEGRGMTGRSSETTNRESHWERGGVAGAVNKSSQGSVARFGGRRRKMR